MRELNDISREKDSLKVIVELTSAFEGIASMHISQIKDLVQNSEKFFADLWRIYRQIRVDEFFRYGRSQTGAKPLDKDLLIVITAEGSFSGDIDERVIHEAMDFYKANKNLDIFVKLDQHNEFLDGSDDSAAHGCTFLRPLTISFSRSSLICRRAWL